MFKQGEMIEVSNSNIEYWQEKEFIACYKGLYYCMGHLGVPLSGGATLYPWKHARKIEKQLPTHEEIMTKWWRDADHIWDKVDGYDHEDNGYCLFGSIFYKEDFADLESADIPPE